MIQMQYLQIYYQQPYISSPQDNKNLVDNSTFITPILPNLDSAKVDKGKIGVRKESCEGS